MKKNNVIIIMPAYNAAKTIKQLYEKIPHAYKKNIIIIDDCSKDDTYKIAKKLGMEVYQNNINLGYGGNVKTCIQKALQKGADVIVEMHPDGEYDPSAIPIAVKEVEKGADLVLGNRFTKETNPLLHGMRIWKYIPSKILSLIDNAILGTNITDLHQGFRVYTKKGLEKINYLDTANDYLFSFEIIVQTIFAQEKIAQVPVKTRYAGEKRGSSLKDATIYTIKTWKVIFLFLFAKFGVHPTSLFVQKDR